MNKPILVIQLQRMGDLILSFPLFLWLLRRYQGRKIRVLARRIFFEDLLPVSPAVDYIDPDFWSRFCKDEYFLSVNLSLGQEAAEMHAAVRSEEKFGPIYENNSLRILGNWQLYRASLVHNNRYNLMHWADMNALDCVPLSILQQTRWQSPGDSSGRKIGLFIGASQAEKRPDAIFWRELVSELIKRNCFPVLLGGEAEKELAAEIVTPEIAKVPVFCGHFSLSGLADFCKTLDLFVTPDTGPMHLAAWVGVRVLNLSLGPVKPWETGPYQSGHFILSSSLSCRGCWECDKESIVCRDAFVPTRVAALIGEIVKNDGNRLEKINPPKLDLFTTSRFSSGLYALKAFHLSAKTADMACSEFWQAFFCHIFAMADKDAVLQAGREIRDNFPQLFTEMSSGLVQLASRMNLCRRRPNAVLDFDFWRECVPQLRILSGYIQLFMQNEGLNRTSFLRALELVELSLFFCRGNE